MSVSVCMFALSTLRVTKFLLKNFTTTTTTHEIFVLALVLLPDSVPWIISFFN